MKTTLTINALIFLVALMLLLPACNSSDAPPATAVVSTMTPDPGDPFPDVALWRHNAAYIDSTSELFASKDRVYISEQGAGNDLAANLLALDAKTGKEQWRHPVQITGGDPGIEVDGVVYLTDNDGTPGTGQGALYALDAQTGKVQWKVAADKMPSTAAALNGVVYIGLHQASDPVGQHLGLHTFESKTGKELCTLQVDTGPDFVAGYFYLKTTDDTLLVEAGGHNVKLDEFQQYLYALDASTGQQLWNLKLLVDSGYGLDKRAIYYSSTPDTISSLDARTGKELWKYDEAALKGERFDTTVVQEDSLYVGVDSGSGEGGSILALNTQTGVLKWKVDMHNDSIDKLAASGDRVYVDTYVGDGDSLYSLDAQTGKQVWVRHAPGTDHEIKGLTSSNGAAYFILGFKAMYAVR